MKVWKQGIGWVDNNYSDDNDNRGTEIPLKDRIDCIQHRSRLHDVLQSGTMEGCTRFRSDINLRASTKRDALGLVLILSLTQDSQ